MAIEKLIFQKKENKNNNLVFNLKSTIILAPSLFLFIAVGLVIYWKLGSFPDSPDYNTIFSIKSQIDHFLDGAPLYAEDKWPSNFIQWGYVQWVWMEMHQGQSGFSPLFSFLVLTGFDFFGFNLLGLRFPVATLCFLSIIFFYFSARKYIGKLHSVIFLLVLCSSPWFLIIARSGSLVGMSLAMVTITISLMLFMFDMNAKKNQVNDIKFNLKNILMVLITSISVSLLPYGYTPTRPIMLLMLLLVLLNAKKLGWWRTGIFFGGAIAIFSLQLNNISLAFHNFFAARGEAISISVANLSDLEKLKDIFSILTRNAVLIVQQLIIDPWNYSLNTVVLENIFTQNPKLYYPMYWVPCLIIGFCIFIKSSIIKPLSIHTCVLAFFIFSLIPGLASRIGVPNPARMVLAMIPIYLFIATAFLAAYKIALERKSILLRNILCFFVSTFLVFGSSYQIYNFFNFEIERFNYDSTSYKNFMVAFNKYYEAYPNAKFIFETRTEVGLLSYGMIKFRGGKELQQLIKNKKVILVLANDFHLINNFDEITNLTKSNDLIIFITSSKNDLQNAILQDKSIKLNDIAFLNDSNWPVWILSNKPIASIPLN